MCSVVPGGVYGSAACDAATVVVSHAAAGTIMRRHGHLRSSCHRNSPIDWPSYCPRTVTRRFEVVCEAHADTYAQASAGATRAGNRRRAGDLGPSSSPPPGRPHPPRFAFLGYRNGKESSCRVDTSATPRVRPAHVGVWGEFMKSIWHEGGGCTTRTARASHMDARRRLARLCCAPVGPSRHRTTVPTLTTLWVCFIAIVDPRATCPS